MKKNKRISTIKKLARIVVGFYFHLSIQESDQETKRQFYNVMNGTLTSNYKEKTQPLFTK